MKYGARGQVQNGVDILGRPNRGLEWGGIQCKLKGYLTERDIVELVERAKAFRPGLSSFTIATTSPSDQRLQALTRRVAESTPFIVSLASWDDIVAGLSAYPELIAKYIPLYPPYLDRSKGGPIITLDLVSPELISAISQTPELLHALEWRTFERLLARVLEMLDYEIELQQGTKDGGVDIFAISRKEAFGQHRYLLQAKRWSNAVGVEPVRELLFLHGYHKVTKSCLATTSKFTRGAWDLAREHL
jgi:Restriction endonuclease